MSEVCTSQTNIQHSEPALRIEDIGRATGGALLVYLAPGEQRLDVLAWDEPASARRAAWPSCIKFGQFSHQLHIWIDGSGVQRHPTSA